MWGTAQWVGEEVEIICFLIGLLTHIAVSGCMVELGAICADLKTWWKMSWFHSFRVISQ
jgi:hypothetical protein